jgi:hypothetical protein
LLRAYRIIKGLKLKPRPVCRLLGLVRCQDSMQLFFR